MGKDERKKGAKEEKNKEGKDILFYDWHTNNRNNG